MISAYLLRRHFNPRYRDDEYRSDEYAIKGLFLINPDLVSWHTMYCLFRYYDECEEKRPRPILNRLKRDFKEKIGIDPHPKDSERIQNARKLYNKYLETAKGIRKLHDTKEC